MKIIKRNGQTQDVSFDKILHRIKNLANDKTLGILNNVEPDLVSQQVIHSIFDGVTTSELDELASRISISLSTEHPEYSTLAARIIISNMHKNTQRDFSAVIEGLYNNINENGEKVPLVSKELFELVKKHKSKLNNAIDYNRDYFFDFFGYKTLERSYLLKTVSHTGRKVCSERPQTMWMRVSLGINSDSIDNAIQSYHLLSQGFFTHATPTLFNFGTPRQQGSSCFLLNLEDSMAGIYKCLSDCAIISKHAGGIGLSASKVRSNGSQIKGTNGKSDGIVKMLKVFNETARFSNQGSKRNGSIAIYLEVFHDDIFEFLELRKNSGDENLRARDLFYALWICDAFMEAVEKDLDWYLMSPDTSPGLTEVHSEEFEQLYYDYIAAGKYKRKIRARDLWNKILSSQIETGMPYISYKDSVNKKTNHQNLGTIQCSNLCNEILIYSDSDDYGTCNIATLGLAKYVETTEYGVPTFNHKKLYEVSKFIVHNLNKIIDKNFYPVEEALRSNFRSRPIAIGVQGLANAFFKMRISFESSEARALNKLIFETIYFGALEASNELAITLGPYPAYADSPFSKGILQFDMWQVSEDQLCGHWDWKTLKENIIKYGTYNSLLTALPPT
ncbi:MAG: ribonucleoside-diphosphate reductase subunit alpha, partial [Alphaproteobacteria bacterium]